MEVSGRRSGQSDGTGQSSTEEEEIFCQPCSSEDDWVVAKGYCQNCNEYFCIACLKLHRKQTVSRNHVILEGTNMPNTFGSKVDLESCSELCVKHTNEIVKFYCSSHDTIGCGDCMILEHTACKIERIQDISTPYLNGPECSQLAETVAQFLEDILKLRHFIETSEEEINGTYTKVVADIRALRKEVNDYLDRAEAEIQAEVDRRKEEIEKTISELTEELQPLHTEIKELEEKLKLQSNKANELYVAAKKMKGRMASLERIIKQMMENSPIQQYKFEPSPDMERILSFKVPLGSLKSITRKGHSEKKIEEMEAQFDGEIDLKTSEDELDCFIIASALISPGKIILVDIKNSCLKLVDTDQKKLCTRYRLCSKPADVAVVSMNLIAFTLPDQRKIKFLSLTQKNVLTESHDIKVNGEGRIIACQNDNIIIGYRDKIEIIDMKGEVVQEISSAVLTWIMNIVCAHDSKAFYVSHGAGQPAAVYKFDIDGNLLATYKDKALSGVRGLTVTPDGGVLACNWDNIGSIHIISPECKKIKEMLKHNDNVHWPYCVSFCNETCKRFLCSFEGKHKNVMKIFLMV